MAYPIHNSDSASQEPPEEMAIQAAALTKSYGAAQVLKGVDLAVRRGTVFALLGPNGAGKTTTVRVLATLTKADTGEAKVAGYDVCSQQPEVRQRISLTGQYVALDGLQTATENLQMMGRLCRMTRSEARQRAHQLLDQFALEEAANRRVGTYSGGMRRRLDLAAGLVGRPEVIFLDEPTTGLDPRGRKTMWGVITALAATGTTVFLTTQYLEEADQVADRVAIIDGGRIVAQGTAEELKRRAGSRRLDIRLANTETFDELAAYLGTRAVHADRGLLTLGVATPDEAAAMRGLLDELDPERSRITHFDQHVATLDDAFIELTGRRPPTVESEPSNV